MSKNPIYHKKLYGTATVGSKGQIVIPSDARKEMGIEEGDRLYVIGAPDGGFLGLLKEEALQEMVQSMSAQIETFQSIKNSNKE
ncbi:MAG TPA: AbrB/MazE/SpoVT family DNA-binding domain-containing protein [Candidatus Saccharimonadales bacterium]|nr:AbrB/MazE/SpoVT family DNA-binding domain-containing protein [Candidatus Saccharimonadales bacterium]